MKKHQKVAEIAAILVEAGKIGEATKILEGFLKTTKEASSPGFKVIDAEIMPDDIPEDDYDDEFAVPIDITFEVTEPLLSKLFQKQMRVMDRFMAKLTSQEALRAIRGGRMSKVILKGVRPAATKEMVNMARDDFNRQAYLMEFDFSSETDNWWAKVSPHEKMITYTIQFDILGRWH